MNVTPISEPLLRRATNLFGPIEPKIKARVAAVLNAPTQETWEDAYSIIVSERGMTTLWQAWLATCDDAPRSKPCDDPWPRIPTRAELIRALAWATRAA